MICAPEDGQCNATDVGVLGWSQGSAAGGQKDNKKIVGKKGGNYSSVQMVCPRDLGKDVGFVWRTINELGCRNRSGMWCGREPEFMDGDKRDFMGNVQTTGSTFAFSRDPLTRGECLNDFRRQLPSRGATSSVRTDQVC